MKNGRKRPTVRPVFCILHSSFCIRLSHLNATSKPPQSHPHATLKPPPCYPKAPTKRQPSLEKANSECRMKNEEWPAEKVGRGGTRPYRLG